MGGPRRNDTNRPGRSAGSQFDDQSDDVPQEIMPTWYRSRGGYFHWSWPHPLLCGPNGVITVMPDHPHEGECVVPALVDERIAIAGRDLGAEYPPATAGARPLPEIVSRSQVLSGTTSGGKEPTEEHDFGGIAAYDGHRAGVGRVVTDATWHHFVNINLTGVVSWSGQPVDAVKDVGFLASPAGVAVLEQVQTYYRNIVTWASRPERLRCMSTRLLWGSVWSDRVLEAVLSTTRVRLQDLDVSTLILIGGHARDVLGRSAGQCALLRIVIDLVLERELPDLIPDLDPWIPFDEPWRPGPRPQWLTLAPLVDAALGGALVALHTRLEPPAPGRDDLDADRVAEIVGEGGAFGVKLALASLAESLDGVRRRL